MPAERIAENLAYINWTVLATLAAGAFGTAVLARLRTDATRGYVAFAAICGVMLGVLAVASDGALPAPAAGSPIHVAVDLDGIRRAMTWAFCGLGLAWAVMVARGRSAPALGLAGVAAAGAVLGFGAAAWGGSPGGAALLGIELLVLAAATGGAFGAMVLGHWYLVTPRLPEAPLVLVARLLFVVIGVQVALFVAWTTIGAGPGGSPGFAALTGPWAMFVWLRLIVGLLFPLVVAWAAVRTARTRSMESATGLLYIEVGTIAAGTILAAGLYFGAGLLV